jgi:hypothetical protein
MLNDASGFQHIFLCTRYTDLRKGIDGLISIVTGTFGLDPTEAGSIFLFCGRRNDRMKVLLYEGDGWLLCYKRFADGSIVPFDDFTYFFYIACISSHMNWYYGFGFRCYRLFKFFR